MKVADENMTEKQSVIKNAAKDFFNFIRNLPKFDNENSNDIVDINDPKNFTAEEYADVQALKRVQNQINNYSANGGGKNFKEAIKTTGRGGSTTISRMVAQSPSRNSRDERIRS